MPLRAFSFCAYFVPDRTEGGDDWSTVRAQNRQDIFAATKFVKAIKREPFNGFADVPVAGRSVRLDTSTRDHVYDWFAEMALAAYQRPVAGCVHLVPAPGSGCTSAAAVNASPIAQLCRAMAGRFASWDVQTVLWWRQPIQSARRGGGSRDAEYKYTMLVPPVVPRDRVGDGHTWILIDDNISSGGTLRAMAKRLRDVGVVPPYAVSVSHTVHSIENAFQVKTHDLADL